MYSLQRAVVLRVVVVYMEVLDRDLLFVGLKTTFLAIERL